LLSSGVGSHFFVSSRKANKAYLGGKKVANHKSAEKRNRQNIKKQTRNASRRSRVYSAIRKLKEVIEKKDVSSIKETLAFTSSEIMKAKTKGIFHAKTASRKVARLYRSANQILAKK
jgi:small subunit ribosomal protein S20